MNTFGWVWPTQDISKLLFSEVCHTYNNYSSKITNWNKLTKVTSILIAQYIVTSTPLGQVIWRVDNFIQ